MQPRERVFQAMAHREPDRVPIYLWVFGQPGVIDDINARHGSMEAFCDFLDLDLCQTFPSKGFLKEGPPPREGEERLRDNTYGNVFTLEEALDAPFNDADDPDMYVQVRQEVEHHKRGKGRAIFLQTAGVFEASNGVLGMEQHLMEMAARPAMVRQLYERIARWNHRYIENALEIGVDVIHISDDWGMNNALLFRPKQWWELVYPTEKITTDFVRARGVPLSLHSDGYVGDIMEGIVELGFDVVHPNQESAGMDLQWLKREYGDRLAFYGGLDVRTVLGCGDVRRVEDEVRRVMDLLKPGGGFIFCTSHMVQPGTRIEEVEAAYAVARDCGKYE